MKKLKLFAIIIAMFLFITAFSTVHAAEMSNEFKSILTDGKLVLNSFQPTNADEAMLAIEMYIMENNQDFTVDSTSYNKDYTSCKILYKVNPSTGKAQEEHVVSIEYKYDANIKKYIDAYVAKLPAGGTKFEVKDMELVNFWVNAKGNTQYLVNYSEDFKKYVDYKNFALNLRMGDASEFYTMCGGIADFKYEGTIYAIKDGMQAEAKHILYVPTNTTETKEALVKAIQERIDNSVGKGKVKVTAGEKTIPQLYSETYKQQIEEAQAKLDAEKAKPAEEQNQSLILQYQNELDNAKTYLEYFEKAYNTKDGDWYFLHDAIGDYYFTATVGDKEHMFIVVKNDTITNKTVEHKTADLTTNVTVETKNAIIPLDTQIKVEKLTSGAEYDKIVKILNVEESEMFDIKLYSESTNKYVTKLENGTFEVKIPLDPKFEGKNLVVYYTDEAGKVTEYTVKVKDGYATFTTNHFSIYTLAVKTNNNTKPEKDETPKTGIVNTTLAVSILTIISVAGITILKNNKK